MEPGHEQEAAPMELAVIILTVEVIILNMDFVE